MAQKRFLKGLFKDTAHIDQPEGSWRHARNAILNQTKGAISNEGGNIAAGLLYYPGFPTDRDVIGVVEVENNQVILFSYNNDDSYSEIGIWETGQYKRVYYDNLLANTPGPSLGQKGLEFSINYPIEGTYNISPKGDLIVYWTDDNNPPRALNITLQQSTGIGNTAKIYGIDSTSSHKNHIDLLNLFPHSGPVPHIDVAEITLSYPLANFITQLGTKEGGGLLTGVYYLSLAYVDDSYTATNFLTMSNPISIVDEGDHTRPTTKKDGAPESTQTSKSITWNITNMNSDYKFIRPVIIRKMGAAVDAYRLNDVDVPLTANNINITFSGIEGFTPTSLEDVIIDTISYETAKTINQLDGILYVGNTTSTEDLGYQKYANNIKLNAKTKEIKKFDENIISVDNLETGFNGYPVDSMDLNFPEIVRHNNSYRYMPNIFKYKGYMRDEVYAFYIAFILNDGSMSYAYHIPGREDTLEDKDPLEDEGWFIEFKKLNPSFIKRFHLHDYSDLPGNRNMNYWENATEVYPDTENFEVWNGLLQGTDLKGLNVRHHHFPSNGNPEYKTIHDNTSEITDSQGIVYSAENWISHLTTANQTCKVTYIVIPDSSHNVGCYSTDGWLTVHFESEPLNSTHTNPTAYPGMLDALWKSNRYFVADQPMDVKVKYHITFYSDDATSSSGNCQKVRTNLVHVKPSGQVNVITTNDWTRCNGSGWNSVSSTSSVIAMDLGDKLYLRSKNTGGGCDNYWVQDLRAQSNPGTPDDYIQFEVACGQGQYEPGDLHDCKLSHNVKVLGFELEDVKIPSTMAKKIQGFRIYRATRKHEDKRILGQGVLTPMEPDNTTMGRCKESATSIDADMVMNTTDSLRESILTKDPWTAPYSDYSKYPLMYKYDKPSDAWNNVADEHGYKHFSFNDFNLLRTQNSLAGATHIKPEYFVTNFVWNGPTMHQPRKMISKIVEDDGNGAYSTPIKKIEQYWGWDKAFNCYSKKIKSAIFAGCHYKAANSQIDGGNDNESSNDIRHHNAAPRLIGQKAKSYIPGDSIFSAAALGFGGKISNEFGESTLIFALRDTHELRSSQLRSTWWLNNADWPASGISSNPFALYGTYHDNAPSILVNYKINNISPYNSTPTADEKINNRRSNVLMSNLHAFKTDVYKSIDNQELVWTGFEILGDDLHNFIFSDDGGPINAYNAGAPDYSTATVQASPNSLIYEDEDKNRGIFGGDIFISRYGFRSTLNNNSIEESCIPLRSIHYHIVESVDNINFRHTESDADLYYPGSIAKRVLNEGGEKDFTHQDNLNYDDSFSAENDLRPTFPLPLSIIEQTDFPTRAHRSVKRDTTNLTDNYRLFLANEFKDIPKNRGELWKLSTLNNLLYFHMEESLYVTKGKQQMKMKDGTEAFVGSGDIFAQEPDEIMQADKGYGGTQSQWAALTCNHGYFFVDINSRKVFLMKDKLTEISTAGLEEWFKTNLPSELEEYGMRTNCLDNPIMGIGLTAIYDPKFKRILLTKKDFRPTQAFIDGFTLAGGTMSGSYFLGVIRFNTNRCIFQRWELPDCQTATCPAIWVDLPFTCDSNWFECKGWTISYYPEFNIWCGFHDYIPYIYFNTSNTFYSITSDNTYIWEHNSDIKGSFYGTIWPFEIEYIHNEYREEDTLLGSFNYTLETFNTENISVLEQGFTSFFVYNTLQISDEILLEYLINTRRVGNNWKINNFRDMAAIAINTDPYYMSTNTNIIGGTNTGTITTSSTESMFTVDGPSELINPLYINTAKEWQNRRKFIDKWAGIRLIYDNVSNNLLNLYSAAAAVRKTYK